MDTEDQLAVNFHVGEPARKKKKIVVSGRTVRERSKKRKHLKALRDEEASSESSAQTSRQSQNVASSSDKKSDIDSSAPVNKDMDRGSEKTSEDPKARKSTGGFLSSLFSKNPSVPKLESPDVTQVVEEVFSNQTFSSVDSLHPHMVKNLESRLGITTMTAIQHKAVPAIMSCDRDVMVQSQTGSGKTLAYAVPIVNRLQAETPPVRRADGTFAVIIVPTRELAVQTYECLVSLVYPFTWIVPGCLMGGEKRKAEKARLRKGINILVATPGRLQDHLEKTAGLNVTRLKWIVIDEADRLLDFGYEKSVQEILKQMKSKCQFENHTVLLSATLTKGVERLAGLSMDNPLRLTVSEPEVNAGSPEAESFAIPEKLQQKYTIVPLKLRLVTLTAFILDKFMKCSRRAKIIVFLSTHVSVDFHHDLFSSVICKQPDDDADEPSDLDALYRLQNVTVSKLHGEMSQPDRTDVFHQFCNARSGVLFCTDVAARGLHLPKVDWIVQYTAPPTCSEYIHRIGRTARAGSGGQSLLFLLPSESEYVSLLNQQQISLEQIDMHTILERLILTDNIQKASKKALHNQTITQNATTLQNAFEQYVLGSKTNTELAGKACLSFIRGYSTYPKDVKSIFNVKTLHLGHVAKSFALRQAPKMLGHKFGGQLDSKEKKQSSARFQKRKMDASKISEFSSGIPKKKKKLKTSDEDS